MPRKLFLYTDPNRLELFSHKRRRFPHRKRPLALVRHLDLFQRALQNLDPRSVRMYYLNRVLRTGQEDLATLFLVKQSNVSHRLIMLTTRAIPLYVEAHNLISETALRQCLLHLALNPVPHQSRLHPSEIPVVLGVAKTFGQSTVARRYGLTAGSVRHIFERTLTVLEHAVQHPPAPPEGSLPLPFKAAYDRLLLVKAHANQLLGITPQSRWTWKHQGL